MTGKLERIRDRVDWLETRLCERKIKDFAEGRTQCHGL
jgi:hypothetical protein